MGWVSLEGKFVEREIEPNQPLDLNQLVMQRSTQIGSNILKSDNRIAALLSRILWTWVRDDELREKLKRLPPRMSRNEARARFRSENSGTLFPMVQELISSNNGSLEQIIDEDYYYRLLDIIGLEMYDLKKQGILNWGVDLGGEPPGYLLGMSRDDGREGHGRKGRR